MPLQERFQEIVGWINREAKGTLQRTISLLVDAEDARAVCAWFGITDKMTMKEESDRLEKWFGVRIWQWRDIVLFLTTLEKEIVAKKTLRMALMMIGHWYSEQRAGGARTAPLSRDEETSASPSSTRTAPGGKVALALVVRSSKLGDLPAVSEPIPLDRVIDLVANAVYFRCSLPPEADAREKELGLADPGLGSPREHDVYLRLEIEGAGDLADARSPFGLKSRLRDQPPRAVHLARRARLDCPPTTLPDFHSI
jgi:hypothetical protein